MRSLHLLAILAALVPGLSVAAADGPAGPATPPRPSVITTPEWLQTPSGEDMRKAAPDATVEDGESGAAVMSCGVTAEGALDACVVRSEQPAGRGFGEAALRLAPHFRMKPHTSDGVPVRDGKVTIPVKFQPPRVVTNPDWAQRPSASQMAQVWPTKAGRHGRGGRASIRCLVTRQGLLAQCRVVMEEPEGSGFGQAGLTLAQYFRMKPQTIDGVPVEGGTVTIPINWSNPWGSTMDGGRSVLTNVSWDAAPSLSDMVAAFPAEGREAGQIGQVTLACRFGDDGSLWRCQTDAENPKRLGFAKAAKDLAERFVGPTRVGDRSTRGMVTMVNFAFDPAMFQPDAAVAGNPAWTRTPTAEELEAVFPQSVRDTKAEGKAVIGCRVGQGGDLQDCTLEKESGPGVGEAALALSRLFQMNLWSSEGLPVIGARLSVPITFRLPE